MPIDLKALQVSISLGNELAFKQLFEHFFGGLFSYSKSLLKDDLLAEEVVEDVFVKLWERRETLPEIRNLSIYLYKAIKYASINAIEKKRKHASLSIDEVGEAFLFNGAGSELGLVSKENCDNILKAVGQLPPKCRLIFRLIKEEGLKYKEVAGLLGLSEKTVENQMNIAFKKIIGSLKTTLPELCRNFSGAGYGLSKAAGF